MKKKLILLLLLSTYIYACSKKSEDSTTSANAQTDIFVASAQSAAEEATDAIAESGTSSSFEPLSTEVTPLTTGTITRDCTTTSSVVSSATVSSGSVDLTFAGSDSVTFSKTVSSATVDITLNVNRSGTESRVWTPATCTGSYANVDWSNIASIGSLTLTVQLNRAINRSGTIVITKANGTTETRNLSDNVAADGTRQVSWTSPTVSGGTITLTKTITGATSRSRTFTSLNGESATSTETITVAEANPLNVTVYRNTSGLGLISKTINSGLIIVAKLDGSVTKCSFDHVTFSFATTNTLKCVPKSGTITCEKYATAEATTADSTVIITFGGSTTSGVTYSVDGGSDEDFKTYNQKGCDLEKAT